MSISGLVLRCCGFSEASDAAAADPRDCQQFPGGPALEQHQQHLQHQHRLNAEEGQKVEPAMWHPSLRYCSVYAPQSAATVGTSSPLKSDQRQQQNCRACIDHQHQHSSAACGIICYPQHLMPQAAASTSFGASTTGSNSLRRYRKRSESPMFNPYLRPRSCNSLEDIQVWSQRKTGAILMAAAAARAEADAMALRASSGIGPHHFSGRNSCSSSSSHEMELSGYLDG